MTHSSRHSVNISWMNNWGHGLIVLSPDKSQIAFTGRFYCIYGASQVTPVVKACQCRRQRQGFDPWVRKSPWRRPQQPIPVFLPENPTDRGAWQATVHRVAKSQMWLKRLDTHALHLYQCFLKCSPETICKRIPWFSLKIETLRPYPILVNHIFWG